MITIKKALVSFFILTLLFNSFELTGQEIPNGIYTSFGAMAKDKPLRGYKISFKKELDPDHD